MAKKITGYVKLQIKAGEASPSPPVGPALGSKGLNIMKFCKEFNDRTKNKEGKVLPIVITVYSDKSYDFIIKTPPTGNLILESASVKKGSPASNRDKVGTISMESVKKIAEMKMPDLNCFSIESAIKMVAGTARSIGIVVEDK